MWAWGFCSFSSFFRELVHLFVKAGTDGEVDLVLGALTLVDLTLVGSLIVMVML
jgi:uncharacterized membrane protein YqhA